MHRCAEVGRDGDVAASAVPADVAPTVRIKSGGT
jgi:hypothetical protein